MKKEEAGGYVAPEPVESYSLDTAPVYSMTAWENRMINLAYSEMERRILTHEATAQELLFFAKQGSQRNRTEVELLNEQVALAKAKTDKIQSDRRTEDLFEEVKRAMRIYSGYEGESDEEDDYDDYEETELF